MTITITQSGAVWAEFLISADPWLLTWGEDGDAKRRSADLHFRSAVLPYLSREDPDG